MIPTNRIVARHCSPRVYENEALQCLRDGIKLPDRSFACGTGLDRYDDLLQLSAIRLLGIITFTEGTRTTERVRLALYSCDLLRITTTRLHA